MDRGTGFKPVLDDPTTSENPDEVEKVLFVSGKLYYELAKEKANANVSDKIAIIRLEVHVGNRPIRRMSFTKLYFQIGALPIP